MLRKYSTPDGTDLLRHGDLEGSALVDAWLDVEALQYKPAVHAVFVQHRVVPALCGTPDEAAICESVVKLRKVLELYKAQLGERSYLAGDTISLADLSHFPYTHYFMAMPYVVFDEFPTLGCGAGPPRSPGGADGRGHDGRPPCRLIKRLVVGNAA